MSTRPFPELRPVRWDICVAACVAALAVICGAALWTGGNADGDLTAEVSVEGSVVERISLEGTEENRTYHSRGYTLQVEVRDGQIAVTASDCPTQDCVHTGAVSHPGQSIVCLPARLVIQVQGGEPSDGVDLVIG